MRRLVLADDSKTIQKVVSLLFEEEDFEVQCFENGASALEHIRSRGADIVLADAALPILDGYELCREVKQDPRTASLPVVLLAGTMEPLDEARATAVGSDSSLTKPFETSRLIRLVKDLVETPPLKEESYQISEQEPSEEAEAPEQRVQDEQDRGPELQSEGSEQPLSGGVQDQGSESVERQEPAEIVSFSVARQGEMILHLPVFLSSGNVYFELSEEQCAPCLAPLDRVLDRPSRPQLTPLQMDALTDEVLKKLPETIRAMLPDIAKSVLRD